MIYYDPRQPGSYAGKKAFQRVIGSPVKDWLLSQEAYTLHKPIRRNFQRRRVVVGGIDEQWQADLVDLISLKKENKNFQYLLTVIDVFSKFAWVEPLKQKTGKCLVKSFANILKKSKRSPKALQTDKGTEFVNKFFQKWLKDKKIHFFTTHNEETKACVVERFNRTLKTRTWRYFTAKNTRKYLNILQGLVHNYNPSFHRSIKRTPASVSLENQKVWQTLYGCASSVKLPKIA